MQNQGLNPRSVRLAMVAGEASGDLLAGLLLQGLHTRWPGKELSTYGIGGVRMVEQGFDAWWPSDKLAVRGYVEVLRHYREIAGIRQQLKKRLLGSTHRPDIFIGVDAPDFNLALEADLRQAGIKTMHFVCPSIWAWRASRIDKIRQGADHVLCVFPFEPALLASQGIAATFVGHPLANAIALKPDKAAARQSLGIAAEDTVVALLPGSRASEIDYLALCFFQAASHINTARAAIKFIVPAMPALQGKIEALARQAVLLHGSGADVQIFTGQSHAVLAACDVAIVASGTATLEAALFKRPMVIAYKMHWLSWQIMRKKQLQPWVGLPNILCREFVVPELLQEAATPEAIALATLRWLDEVSHTREKTWVQPHDNSHYSHNNPPTDKIAALEQRFTDLHRQLQGDTARLASEAIGDLLG